MKTLIKSQTSFMPSMAQLLSNHTQAISRLEVQISQLASSLSERLKETLPSQPLTNTRNSSQAHGAQDQQINQCNIVHTLRSGKQVDNQVSMPSTPIQHNPTQALTSSSSTSFNSDKSEKDKSVDQMHKPIVPSSNRLKSNNQQTEQMEKILEMFNKVKINAPLHDAIQQVPL